MLNAVYVTEPGSKVVARKGSVLIIKRNGDKAYIPPNTDTVIIASSRIALSSKAIKLLVSRDIDLIFLDSYGRPTARITPPIINKTVSTRVRQYSLFNETKSALELAREFITCKIENQARLIRYLGKSRGIRELMDKYYELSSLATQLDSTPLSQLTQEFINSIEAAAAKKYWSLIQMLLPPELGFEGRNPDSVDVFNVALNYGYGILYSLTESQLLIVGLDPYLGVLHTAKSGKASLVYDFVEPFRPIAVDKPLITGARELKNLKLFNGFLDYDSRRTVAKLIIGNLNEQYMYTKAGKRMSLIDIIRHETWDLASTIRGGSVKDYRCFNWVF
ncbi:CRISPR-associated endonuclease Cas1 [Caldivirga sp.]|uniref:CRISPR-associated endonuclease Cas1 n=1 Tax=Caldivirga sp. TaxID=2080243 RepID=UPI003D12099A